MAIIRTNHVRSPRLLIVHLLGKKIKGSRVESSDDLGHRCGGRDVVLPCHIHCPPRACVDIESWAGKCDRFRLWAAVDDVRRVSV